MKAEEYDDIFCMAKIGSNAKPAFCVCVNPDAGRIGDPYLKYYNAQNYNKADAVIRLELREAKFIYHRDSKTAWNVSKKELRQLDGFLSKKSRDFPKYTNWELTLYHWNYEYGNLDSPFPEQYSTVMDAFMDGYYDTTENLSNPSYMASYSKQPNYAELI